MREIQILEVSGEGVPGGVWVIAGLDVKVKSRRWKGREVRYDALVVYDGKENKKLAISKAFLLKQAGRKPLVCRASEFGKWLLRMDGNFVLAGSRSDEREGGITKPPKPPRRRKQKSDTKVESKNNGNIKGGRCAQYSIVKNKWQRHSEKIGMPIWRLICHNPKILDVCNKIVEIFYSKFIEILSKLWTSLF